MALNLISGIKAFQALGKKKLRKRARELANIIGDINESSDEESVILEKA